MREPRLTAEVGIVATASYLPEGWMSAAELADKTGIPEDVIVDRFGLRGKHLASDGENVSDLCAEAGRKVLAETGTDPADIDAVIYFGSTWKDFPVWHAAPRIAHQLGCSRAVALELDYVSCGSPVALRVARALISVDERLRRVLLVAASCESRLLDYSNLESRFMFNFGDGAVAAVLGRGYHSNHVLETAMLTDGSLSQHVKVPAGGSVMPASHETVEHRRHYLDVEDLSSMRDRLDEVSMDNFALVCDEAATLSGVSLADVAFVCPIHMKRSMHHAILDRLGCKKAEAVYLDDTGHMSGVDPLLSVDRLVRAGRLRGGDIVLLVAAGTGYTWAATVLQWGARPI